MGTGYAICCQALRKLYSVYLFFAYSLLLVGVVVFPLLSYSAVFTSTYEFYLCPFLLPSHLGGRAGVSEWLSGPSYWLLG